MRLLCGALAAFLDCLPEAQGFPKELRGSFVHVAAKAKFQARHWEGVSDEFSLLGGGGGGSLAPVVPPRLEEVHLLGVAEGGGG